MRILALIPARGGSKRVPGKNIRSLGGKPLIVWSIEVAKNINDICDILVSTDDINIAEIARQAGALTPWLRPNELASDTATSIDVAKHALDWYEKEHGDVDGLLLLQPTSPFRGRNMVIEGIRLFSKMQHKPVVGVAPANSHPMWCFRLRDGLLEPFMELKDMHLRSQDLPPAYIVSGALYIISPTDLRAKRSFFTNEAIPLVVEDDLKNIDIDTEVDWMMAEAMLNYVNNN